MGRSTKLTNENLSLYASRLGYQLSIEDCDEIRMTSYHGETVSHAVRDYLNAFEAPMKRI